MLRRRDRLLRVSSHLVRPRNGGGGETAWACECILVCARAADNPAHTFALTASPGSISRFPSADNETSFYYPPS